MNFPETLSKEMNKRYRDCQKVVEFIKSLGYKSDLNINNILFPSMREMQRILEFTLEIITSVDTGAGELAQGMTEKNFAKVKFGKQLTAWHSQLWVIPELNDKLYAKKIGKVNEYSLKIQNTKLGIFKKLKFPKKFKSRLELEIEKFLIANNINFISQKVFKDISNLKFDFYLPDYNIILEPGGEQYFIPIKRWGGEEKFKTKHPGFENKSQSLLGFFCRLSWNQRFEGRVIPREQKRRSGARQTRQE